MNSPNWNKVSAIAAVIGVVVAILFGVLTQCDNSDGNAGARLTSSTVEQTNDTPRTTTSSPSTTLSAASGHSPDTTAATTTTGLLEPPNASTTPPTQATAPTPTTEPRRAVPLTDLEPVEGQWSTGSVEMGGAPYMNSVYKRPCYVACSDTWRVGYNLGARYERFVATVGVGDNSDLDASFLMEVYLDGVREFSEVVTLGSAMQVDLEVAGVLRLELFLDPERGHGAATFGDPTLVPPT